MDSNENSRRSFLKQLGAAGTLAALAAAKTEALASLADGGQAQGVAGSSSNATGPNATGVTPKAAILKPGWRPLLDEKLTSWELWMGVPHETVVGLPEGTPTSPTAHELFNSGVFATPSGYLVFNGGPGTTLGGVWSAIAQNGQVNIGGHNYNEFVLYTPLPWPPTPGADTFYASAAFPIGNISTPWASGTYAVNYAILDPNGNVQVVLTAGTTGGSIPTFATTVGATTSDGSVVWRCAGAIRMGGFPYVPGPSQALGMGSP